MVLNKNSSIMAQTSRLGLDEQIIDIHAVIGTNPNN